MGWVSDRWGKGLKSKRWREQERGGGRGPREVGEGEGRKGVK